MKNLVLISLLFCSAILWGQEISIKQEFYIPENAANNDSVGDFKALYPVLDTASAAVTFSLTDNEGGIYAISSTGGMIRVANNSTLAAGIDVLIVESTCGDVTDTDTVLVHVIATANCVFVDPAASAGGNGSRTTPHDAWADITIFEAGHGYFIKRGATLSTSRSITGKGTPSNLIYISSYGTGNQPILTGGSTAYGFNMSDAAYVWISSLTFNDCAGIYMENQAGGDSICHDNRLTHLTMTNGNNPSNGYIYIKWNNEISRGFKQNHYIAHCDMSYPGDDKHGIKAPAGTTIENCKLYNGEISNASGTQLEDSCVVRYCVSEDFTRAFQIRGNGNLAEYNIVKSGYSGIFTSQNSDITPTTRSGSIIRYNTVTASEFGIDVTDHDNGQIYENVVYGNVYGILNYGGDGNRYSRNKVYSNTHGIRVVSGTNDYDTIDYNLVYSNSQYGISLNNIGTGVTLRNNVVVKNTIADLYNQSSSVTSINNIYHTTSGTFSHTTSHDFDNGNPFNDYTNNNFSLVTGSTLINTGTNWGQSYDYLGLSITDGSPDIGAYEYGASPEPGPIPTPTNTVIVWSENWDDATSAQDWTYMQAGWWDTSDESLVDVTGRGKVFRMNFKAGEVGTQGGFGNYQIPLDSAYKELYLSFDYSIASNWDWGFSDGKGSGKFGWTFGGGVMPPIPSDATAVNTGWRTLSIWGEGDIRDYNYVGNNTYTGDGWPYGQYMTSLIKGQWRNLTYRAKIEDPGQSNGFLELYVNGVLSYQRTGMKYNYGTQRELIDHIYANLFWGGAGAGYECPVDTWVQFDNLVAFYYPPGHENYRSGLSELNRSITIPVATDHNPNPPNIYNETTYTEASGVIDGHCGFEWAATDLNVSYRTSTIQVSGASSITINVTKFSYDGGITYTPWRSVLNIYSGTGGSKTLVRKFENSVYTSTPTQVNITGGTATIEYRSGWGKHQGFRMTYTSNGSGSGDNFECTDMAASQTGIGPAPPPPPPPDTCTGIIVTICDSTGSASDSLAFGFNNNTTATYGEETLTLQGGALYSGIKIEGTHSLNTDGSGRYATISEFSLLDTFRVNVWIAAYGLGDHRVITGNFGSTGSGWQLRYMNNGSITFYTSNGSSTQSAFTASSTFTTGGAGQYITVEGRRSTGEVKIYRNGVDVTVSGTILNDFGQTGILGVGAANNGDLKSWGYIDDLSIWTSDLSVVCVDTCIETTPIVDFDTLKINVTTSGREVSGWNNFISTTQNDSIHLRTTGDSLTSSYAVLETTGATYSITPGEWPLTNYDVPQTVAQDNVWRGTNPITFRISNVPEGYYRIIAYGSRAGTEVDYIMEMKVNDTDSLSWVYSDNAAVYSVNTSHQGGDMTIEFSPLDIYFQVNFFVIHKTENVILRSSSDTLHSYDYDDSYGTIYDPFDYGCEVADSMVRMNGWVIFKNVVFTGNENALKFAIRGITSDYYQISLDGVAGDYGATVIANAAPSRYDDTCTVEIETLYQITGTHDVYVRFMGGSYTEFGWLTFYREVPIRKRSIIGRSLNGWIIIE